MTPEKFEQANCFFGPPEGLTESQVHTIHAYSGPVEGGSLDGSRMIITCWKPSEAELEELKSGKPVFVFFLGVLPPHYVCTDFEHAKSVA